jgi:hypothetical protein
MALRTIKQTNQFDEALEFIVAQAQKDAKKGVKWLRRQIEGHQALDPDDDVAVAIADALVLEIYLGEAWIDSPYCTLILSYGVRDLAAYRLEELQPAFAEVSYAGPTRVWVDGQLDDELHALFVEAQKIQGAVIG